MNTPEPHYVDADTLPPLRVAVFRDGKLEKVHTLPDPRVAYCRAYGAMDTGAVVKAIVEVTA